MVTWLRVEKRRLAQSFGIACGGLSFAACLLYPDSEERLNDDIVFTGHAHEVDFKAYQTFAVDPVVHVATIQEDFSVQTQDADADMSDRVTSHVADELASRGYRRVEQGDNPDLGVTITGMSGLEIGSISGGYWDGYYSSYWGFPGWTYYYPYDVYYTYQTGTLLIDVADLATAREEEQEMTTDPDAPPTPRGLAVVWTMLGYQAYVEEDINSRVSSATRAIDQAFTQSPYLTRK